MVKEFEIYRFRLHYRLRSSKMKQTRFENNNSSSTQIQINMNKSKIEKWIEWIWRSNENWIDETLIHNLPSSLKIELIQIILSN